MKNNSKNNNNDGTKKASSSKYGIKSNKWQTQVEDLIVFEEGMIDLVHKTKFHKVKSNI